MTKTSIGDRDKPRRAAALLALALLFCSYHGVAAFWQVGDGNPSPVAGNDAVAALQNSVQNVIDVLVNDSAPTPGDSLTITSVGTPDNGGSVSINGAANRVLYTPTAGFLGAESFTYDIGNGQGSTNTATVTVTVSHEVSAEAAVFLQNAAGMISMEAENYQGNMSQATHSWIDAFEPGFSGERAMAGSPDVRERFSRNYADKSPRLDFRVQFSATGTYYIWVRGLGPSSASNSVHVGLDGAERTTSDNIHMKPDDGYVWSNGRHTLDVPVTGVHTVNIWLREDGTLVDKIVITTDAAFVPSGFGPPESQLAKSCPSYPLITLFSPKDGELQTSSDLDVSATVCLDDVVHAGWGVKFVLDDAIEFYDYHEPFEVTFNGISQAEHTVEAVIVDGAGNEAPGVNTSDLVAPVGLGDYYVAIGDSITFGFGDDDSSDDTSLDGRDTGGGYEPVLNDMLTASSIGHPHTVRNEGIGGATAADGLAVLQTILFRHPNAQRFLILFGMNDASPWMPVPSGLRLEPGDPRYPGTYKDSMQQIIDVINATGKEVVLAKTPIALGDRSQGHPYPDPNKGARSLNIQQFNRVIDELVANPANNISIAPPNFYTFFDPANHPGQYSDLIHPNNTGYRSMADLWLKALTQQEQGL